MKRQTSHTVRRSTVKRSLCRGSAMLALLSSPLMLGVTCDSQVGKEFRSAALGSIESGVDSIVDGVIDGLFAIAEVEDSSSSGTN